MQYTRIHLPGLARLGLMRQGNLSVQDMCDIMRATAGRATDWEPEEKAEILAASDSDFCVEGMTNKYRQRGIKTLQPGKKL